MSAGDDMREAAKEAREKASEYNERASVMRSTAIDLDKLSSQLIAEARNLEREASTEDYREKRAQEAIDKAERA